MSNKVFKSPQSGKFYAKVTYDPVVFLAVRRLKRECDSYRLTIRGNYNILVDLREKLPDYWSEVKSKDHISTTANGSNLMRVVKDAKKGIKRYKKDDLMENLGWVSVVNDLSVEGYISKCPHCHNDILL